MLPDNPLKRSREPWSASRMRLRASRCVPELGLTNLASISMPSLISHIADRRGLLEDLNYLNMEEIKSFCDRRGIPYRIFIRTSEGQCRRTTGIDRKGIILDRVRSYLKTGSIPEPTCFPASVVSSDAVAADIKATDRVMYGQYDKKNVAMMTLLKRLTAGKFKDGAIARILANEFWRQGNAPTYKEYAAKWLQAQAERSRPHPEWAFLADLSAGRDTSDWKQQRTRKARRVLKALGSIKSTAERAIPPARREKRRSR
jgi:hypothetical protein